MADDEITRRWATVAGDLAERAVAAALDRIEDGALRVLEQAAAADVGTDALHAAERQLKAARSAGAPLPREVGRVLAGATYFAARWAPATVRTTREAITDTTEYVRSTRGSTDR